MPPLDDELKDPEQELLAQGAGGPEDQGEGAEPEEDLLTRSEFEAALAAAEDRIARRFQSLSDQAESRVQQRFAELQAHNERAIEIAKRGGMNEQQLAAYAEQLRQDAVQRALQGEPGSPGEPPSGQPPPAQDLAAVQQSVTYEGMRLAQSLGLAPGDQELALIDISTGITEAEYFASIRAAARAKQMRASGPPGPNPARLPALGANGRRAPATPGWKKIENADELLEEEWEALRKQG